MPFTTKAYKGLVTHVHKQISAVRYKIGSTYHIATVNDIEEKENSLVIWLQMNPEVTSEVTVSEIAIYDTSNEIFYKKTENIKFNPLNEGILTKLEISFKEVS